MQNQPIPSSLTPADLRTSFSTPLGRTIEYFGSVSYATNERVLGAIKRLMREAPDEEIFLLVTSTGGPTGTAMSFYDTVRALGAPLVTVGLGDVDSSGVIILLSADRRLVSARTTTLLHLCGRVFDSTKRFTAPELEAMAREDRLKDQQYAEVVASHTTMSKAEVLYLMERDTTLSPEALMKCGLANLIYS